MDKRKRQEILATPKGPQLNSLIEKILMGDLSCQCGDMRTFNADTGNCGRCNSPFSDQWCEKGPFCDHIIRTVQLKQPQLRNHFLDLLGEAISYRMGSGKIEREEFIFHALPEDICRAFILIYAEMDLV